MSLHILPEEHDSCPTKKLFSGFEMQTAPELSATLTSSAQVMHHLTVFINTFSLFFADPITQANAAVQPHKHLQRRRRWTRTALSPDFLLEHQHQVKEGRAPPPNASIKASVKRQVHFYSSLLCETLFHGEVCFIKNVHS